MGSRHRLVVAIVLVVLSATACLPQGHLDRAAYSRAAGGVRVTGWARDPDTPEPIDVHVHVDGVPVAARRADLARPDVAAVVPGAGPRHGFDLTLALDRGVRRVCVYGINVGGGRDNPELGCRDVVVPPAGPLPVHVIGSSVLAQTLAETRSVLEARGYEPRISALPSVTVDHPWTRSRLTEARGAPVVVVVTGSNDNLAVAQRADVVGLPTALAEYRARLAVARTLVPGSCVVWVNARDATNPIYRPDTAPATNATLASTVPGDVVVDWAGRSRPYGSAWFVADLLHVDELRDPATGAVIVPGPRRQAGADAHATAIADGVERCAARYR